MFVMLTSFEVTFFSAVISAGAIIAGFCASFLSFRIQREAAYFRQPVSSSSPDRGKDSYVGLTHFTSSMLLLLFATVLSLLFGVVLPLFALGGFRPPVRVAVVVAGVVSSLVVLIGYFADEIVHYRIYQVLPSDRREWKKRMSRA